MIEKTLKGSAAVLGAMKRVSGDKKFENHRPKRTMQSSKRYPKKRQDFFPVHAAVPKKATICCFRSRAGGVRRRGARPCRIGQRTSAGDPRDLRSAPLRAPSCVRSEYDNPRKVSIFPPRREKYTKILNLMASPHFQQKLWVGGCLKMRGVTGRFRCSSFRCCLSFHRTAQMFTSVMAMACDDVVKAIAHWRNACWVVPLRWRCATTQSSARPWPIY